MWLDQPTTMSSNAVAAIKSPFLWLIASPLIQNLNQSIQSHVVEAEHGLRLHAWFGVVGDGQAADAHHGEVVRTVAHADRAAARNVEGVTVRLHRFGFNVSIDDGAGDAPCECAVDDFKCV